jgi:photosystem II stability/assembly factor-like uncharacterized protein
MKRLWAAAAVLFILCALALACNLPTIKQTSEANQATRDPNAPTSTSTLRPTFTLHPTFTATGTNTLTPTPLAVTWNLIGLPTGALDTFRILVHPSDDNLWFALGHPGTSNLEAAMYRTTNGGLSWEMVYTGGIMYVVQVDPNNPDVLYAADDGKLIRSEDLGLSWTVVHDFVDPIESVQISTIDGAIFVAPRLYGDNHPGIYRSMDNGQTWERFAYGLEMINFIPWDIEEDPNTGMLYVVIEIGHHPQPYDPPFYRSSDRGETWEEVGDDLPWHGINIQVDPLTSDVYFLTEGAGLYKSTDQGRHWHRICEDYRFASQLILDPNDPARMFGGDIVHEPAYTGGAYYSDDHGESFIFLGLEGHIIADIALNPSSTRVYIATYHEGIFTAEIPAP